MKKIESPKSQKVSIATFKETLESLVIAFILAFVFRAFVVEAFVIPTGSMADTLHGAHYRLACPNCAYSYDYNFNPDRWGGIPEGAVPPMPIPIVPNNRMRSGPPPICPLCGTSVDTHRQYQVSNGDRILVLKYLYQFFEPQIWDVVVFKNPTDPSKNFIKRLIGVPGNQVHILDGDIYINNEIQRKPEKVQDELWIKVFDLNHQPVLQQISRGSKWQQPFQTEVKSDSAWTIDPKYHRFRFKGGKSESLDYNPQRLKTTLKTLLAYNGPITDALPLVSDLKMEFVLIPESGQGQLEITLGKYMREYVAEIQFSGTFRIVRKADESLGLDEELLSEGLFPALEAGVPVKITFTNVDHSLKLNIGTFSSPLYSGATEAVAWGYDRTNAGNMTPAVRLSAHGDPFTLKHIALYRDIHYTNNPERGGTNIGRATEEKPMAPLGADEFFVLGDNSAASHDSRFWDRKGLDINGQELHRKGIVPRDYLIGKAYFVYWPAGFRPHPKFRFAFIPNIGDMRFIY